MKISSRICIGLVAVVTIALVALSLWRGSSKPKLLAADTSTPSSAPKGNSPAPADANTKSTPPPATQPAARHLPVSRPPAMLAFDGWAEKYLSAPAAEKASFVKEGIQLARARQS